jgi:hypothetical protein
MAFKVNRRTSGRLILAVGAGLVGSQLVAGLALASPGGAGASPPQPTIGEYSADLSRPLTGADQQRTAAKQQRATAYYQALMARAKDGVHPDAATSANLAEPYYQQVNEVYCGPATTTMVAGYLGVGWSGSPSSQQDAAADLLGTTNDGTSWYGSDNVPSYPGTSWYPVQDVLNYRLHQAHGQSGEWYTATPLPDSPTAAQQTQFATNLVYTISHGYPEADNQYSIPGYQLPYQPNGTWYHWWSARGYQDSGNTTGINDPAAFANGQEHWVTTKGGAHTVVVAIGGRGYIW